MISSTIVASRRVTDLCRETFPHLKCCRVIPAAGRLLDAPQHRMRDSPTVAPDTWGQGRSVLLNGLSGCKGCWELLRDGAGVSHQGLLPKPVSPYIRAVPAFLEEFGRRVDHSYRGKGLSARNYNKVQDELNLCRVLPPTGTPVVGP